MSPNKKVVSLLELKKLLHELRDRQSYTCIRVRIIGQLWQQSFMNIATIHDDGVLLHNDTNGKFLNIATFRNIVQFELDHSFQNYLAHFHYDVVLDEVSARSNVV